MVLLGRRCHQIADLGLMAALCIPNLSQCKDLTTIGTVKGKTLPSVNGTRYADDRRHGEQQTKEDLAANGMDHALPCHCCLLPYLGTTRIGLFPAASPTHPHRGDPSK